jgi:tRNA pseudouridine38-40 synthase
MPRFKLTLEYEGTRYSGWQVQKNARTVQGEILNALRAVFGGSQLDLQGAGRTDAGVHALMQVAHLEVQTVLAPEIIRMKLNDELPADINILDVERTSARFHARHDALTRSYLYQISRRRTALGKRYVWWVKDALDVHAMREAARRFEGHKDFRSFTADDPEEKSTTVQVDAVQLKEAGDLLLVRVIGSHFIWKMVRQMVGVLVEVGRGHLTGEDVQRLLTTHSDAPARYTAPPSGLFLEGVYYRGEAPAEAGRPILIVEGGPRRPPRRH